jgi:transcriptional regulator with XRE-family HTH domain
MFRKGLDWKQINLAHEAGIDERTVQRIEAGHPVSDDTRRQIAKAFKLPEDEFLKPHYVPTEEEIHAKIAEVKNRYAVIEAQCIESVHDVEKIMMEHALLIDGTVLPESKAKELAVLKDSLQDWELIFRDITNVERLEACRSLLKQVREIEGEDYQALYAIYAIEDKAKVIGLNIKVAAIAFASKDRTVTQLVVPRQLRDYEIA